MFTSDHSAGTRGARGREVERGAAPARERRPFTLRDVDALSGVAVLAAGLFVLVQSLQLSFYLAGIPGPGFFPAILAVSLVLLGGSLLLRRWWDGPDVDEASPLPSRQQAGRSLLLWLVVLAGALLVGPLGFLAAMLLLVAVIVFGIEGRRGIGAVVTTVLIPLLAWLVFAQLLQVPLPAGPFGE